MTTIQKSPDGYTLLRNGEEFFIKGVVGNRFLERLAQAGGNSIRASVNDLDRAHALGLTVLANLPFGKPRPGSTTTTARPSPDSWTSCARRYSSSETTLPC